jgi:hypothetical protein
MIENTVNWFKAAVPEPTEKNFQVQLGVHFEEIAEMLNNNIFANCPEADRALEAVSELANLLKKADRQIIPLPQGNMQRTDLLDALCDQVVTGVGVAHFAKMDVAGGLKEVSRSNWSKFIEDKPVFLPNGKIGKGQYYTPPCLLKYIFNF